MQMQLYPNVYLRLEEGKAEIHCVSKVRMRVIKQIDMETHKCFYVNNDGWLAYKKDVNCAPKDILEYSKGVYESFKKYIRYLINYS